MSEVTEWAWLIKTAKGEFFVKVVGGWTQEEAAIRLHAVFHAQLKLVIISMLPRKYSTLPNEVMATIYQVPEPPPLDFKFLAGKKLWEVCGRVAEYEAEMLLDKKQGNV